jgi:hypothetical protein
MTRRHAVSAKKKNAKLHPRDKAHPGHAEWLANMTKAQRKRWSSYTPAEKKRRMRKVTRASVAARKLAETPTVAMMLEKTA